MEQAGDDQPVTVNNTNGMDKITSDQLANLGLSPGNITESKLIAAVMAVHMKYAESLHVIENLMNDRKKIDERVKYLENQLKKTGKSKDSTENIKANHKQNQTSHFPKKRYIYIH